GGADQADGAAPWRAARGAAADTAGEGVRSQAAGARPAPAPSPVHPAGASTGRPTFGPLGPLRGANIGCADVLGTPSPHGPARGSGEPDDWTPPLLRGGEGGGGW